MEKQEKRRSSLNFANRTFIRVLSSHPSNWPGTFMVSAIEIKSRLSAEDCQATTCNCAQHHDEGRDEEGLELRL